MDMTKLEKVIEGLECCNMPNNHDDCPYNGAAHYNICTHQLLTDAIALLKEQNGEDKDVPTKWVSVKDRLPENNRFVLVCNDDGHMMVAQYIEETAQWQYKYINYDVDVWDDEEQGPVCWWAELPEPPKEGDSKNGKA